MAALPRTWLVRSELVRKVFGLKLRWDEGSLLIGAPGGYTLVYPCPAGPGRYETAWNMVALWMSVAVLDEYEARAFLGEGMRVVDVGAHAGTFTVLASKLVGSTGRVIAVEPVAENFEHLLRTIEASGLDNVTAVRAALGERSGRLSLFLAAQSGGHSAVKRRTGEAVEVEVTTLDELCRELGVEAVDFVKIDAEGYEPHVLRGGRETISRFRPAIVAAAYHLPEHVRLLPELIRQIAGNEAYEVKVCRAAAGLEVKCFAVPQAAGGHG